MASNNPPLDILADDSRRFSPAWRFPHQDARRQLIAERDRTTSARGEVTDLFERLHDILGALRADLDGAAAAAAAAAAVAVEDKETTTNASTTTTGAVDKEQDDEFDIVIVSADIPLDWIDCTHCARNGLKRQHKAQARRSQHDPEHHHHHHHHQLNQDSSATTNGIHKHAVNSATSDEAAINKSTAESTTTTTTTTASNIDSNALFQFTAALVTMEADARGEPPPAPSPLPLRATTDYILDCLDRDVSTLLTSMARVISTMGEEVDKEMEKKAAVQAQKAAERAEKKQKRMEKKMKREQKEKTKKKKQEEMAEEMEKSSGELPQDKKGGEIGDWEAVIAADYPIAHNEPPKSITIETESASHHQEAKQQAKSILSTGSNSKKSARTVTISDQVSILRRCTIDPTGSKNTSTKIPNGKASILNTNPNQKRKRTVTIHSTEQKDNNSASHESHSDCEGEGENDGEGGDKQNPKHTVALDPTVKVAQQIHKLTIRRIDRLERDLAIDESLFLAHLNKLYNELMVGWRVTYANGLSLHSPLDWRLVEEVAGQVEFAPVEM
ncbi:hypothetical protein BD289DRAFT_235764 [Coniella lustricola]|uniref:Uncharacterized protein n=1 Tax=Coniella lustricola TaxID=2025994 RepID=A0A2T3A9L0_9PEZI|nr:hypothetical protein BD289DRAFT_235764 [Coniella lustricola]